MKYSLFPLIAYSVLINISSLTGIKAFRAQEEANQKDEPSFTIPEHLEGYNSNRYIIKGNAQDLETLVEKEGGIIHDVIGKGQFSVVEFENHNTAEKFRFSISSHDGIGLVDQDTPVYSFGSQVQEDRNSIRNLRSLQESTPWGINKIFEDENGRPNIPSKGYLPDVTHNICIIDSGYELDHPDLPNDASAADPYQRRSSNDDDYFGTDNCGHGSHIAGTILASDNNIGVIGVFPGAPAFIVKVFHSFSCSWTYRSGLSKAVEQCVKKGAKIISMSLGGPFNSNSEKKMFDQIYEDDGVLLIAASGNNGDSSFNYPASYESVISVAAIDSKHRIASFSQYNSQVDISAPGMNIRSTVRNTYKSYSGTSMATPHVSGVALLLWNKYPKCTNKEIRAAIEAGVDDLGPRGRDDYFGHGLLKYWKAAKYLDGRPCGAGESPTAVSPTPPSPSPPSYKNNFRLKLRTDNYGHETTWFIKNSNKDIVLQGGPYDDNRSYTERGSLPVGSYIFRIKDDDGICCDYGDGMYDMYVNGVKIHSGGSFEKKEIVEFDVKHDKYSMSTKDDDISKMNDDDITPTSPLPSTLPPTSKPSCDKFELNIRTDNYGDEVSWFLKDLDKGPVTSGGEYDSNSEYTVTECLTRGSYKLIIKDKIGDGICCQHGSGSLSQKRQDIQDRS
mmetsp:Transcript_29914/g.36424  ORF Transcript_29914/g.36424 Transcript_29914/m.36424 type:complete len:672 (+) Transcript_29914:173-2188(+)